MVTPLGDRKTEQLLKKAMQMCGLKQIFPACDERDALQGIIDDDSKVIAGRSFLSREDDIAKTGGIDLLLTTIEINPGQLAADE